MGFSGCFQEQPATGQRTIKLPSGSSRIGWIAKRKSRSALKKIRLLLIPDGDHQNSGKGSRLLKTTTGRPSIIKKEHVTTKLKGSFGSPLCCLAFAIFLWERACSQKRCAKRHKCWLCRRLREQARSHRGSCSAFFITQFFDADLAHAKLLDLAGHGHRELLDELEMTWRLEVSNALFAPGL